MLNADIAAGSFIRILLSLPLALLGIYSLTEGLQMQWTCEVIVHAHTVLSENFTAAQIERYAENMSFGAVWTGAVALVSSLLGLLVCRSPVVKMLRLAYCCFYLFIFYYVLTVFEITGVLLNAEALIEGDKLTPRSVFYLRWELLRVAFLALILLLFLHLQSWRKVALKAYGVGFEEQFAAGDRIIENIRTHGSDPAFRKSWLTSLYTHCFLLVILPWLLQFVGCVNAYKIPLGTDPPPPPVSVEFVRKKVKTFIDNMNSEIWLCIPNIEKNNPLLEAVIEATEHKYQAQASRFAASGIGKGLPGKPGMKDGFKDGQVRFIRLEHGGPGWDDGMTAQTGDADANFLKAFKEIVQYENIATQGESHRISLLKKYPRHQAPPFVYLTGSGNIPVSENDVEILRSYLDSGGLLFVDCGSFAFHQAFERLVKRIYPNESFNTLARDDPLFLSPFYFPEGSPAFWHHGGHAAKGVKINGRLVIFYHPGDINDAWKTGASGADRNDATKAMQLGINVIYHSFVNYLSMNSSR